MNQQLSDDFSKSTGKRRALFLATFEQKSKIFVIDDSLRMGGDVWWLKTIAVESESQENFKNRKKSEKLDLISYPTFWQKCYNACTWVWVLHQNILIYNIFNIFKRL